MILEVCLTKKKIELTDAHIKVNEVLKEAKNKYTNILLLGVDDNGKLAITSTTNNIIELLGLLELASYEINMGMFLQNQQKLLEAQKNGS